MMPNWMLSSKVESATWETGISKRCVIRYRLLGLTFRRKALWVDPKVQAAIDAVLINYFF